MYIDFKSKIYLSIKISLLNILYISILEIWIIVDFKV